MEGKREGRAPHGWFCKGAEGLISVPHGGEGSTFGVLGRKKSPVSGLNSALAAVVAMVGVQRPRVGEPDKQWLPPTSDDAQVSS